MLTVQPRPCPSQPRGKKGWMTSHWTGQPPGWPGAVPRAVAGAVAGAVPRVVPGVVPGSHDPQKRSPGAAVSRPVHYVLHRNAPCEPCTIWHRVNFGLTYAALISACVCSMVCTGRII